MKGREWIKQWRWLWRRSQVRNVRDRDRRVRESEREREVKFSLPRQCGTAHVQQNTGEWPDTEWQRRDPTTLGLCMTWRLSSKNWSFSEEDRKIEPKSERKGVLKDGFSQVSWARGHPVFLCCWNGMFMQTGFLSHDSPLAAPVNITPRASESASVTTQLARRHHFHVGRGVLNTHTRKHTHSHTHSNQKPYSICFSSLDKSACMSTCHLSVQTDLNGSQIHTFTPLHQAR